MGNQQQLKVIVLRDLQSEVNLSKFLNKQIEINGKKVQFVIYKEFSQFISKQNPKQIKDIIVIYTDPKQHQRTKIIQKSIAMFILQQKNLVLHKQFEDVCPLLASGTSKMKQKLIDYIKKYSLPINIHLYVDQHQTVRLMHYEKPYLKVVSSDIMFILNSMFQQESRKRLVQESQSTRFFEGFYRRIIVKRFTRFENYDLFQGQKLKVVQRQGQKQEINKQSKDQKPIKSQKKIQGGADGQKINQKLLAYEKLQKLKKKNRMQKLQLNELQIQDQKKRIQEQKKILNQNNILPQYFSEIEAFEKSFISTLCEYVICDEEDIMQIIDVKKKCNLQYKIIVRVKPQIKQSISADKQKKGADTVNNNVNLNTNTTNLNKFNNDSFEVWYRHDDFRAIINKIANFTEISSQERPQNALNIIFCGSSNDQCYKRFIKQFKGSQIQSHIKQLMANQIQATQTFMKLLVQAGQKLLQQEGKQKLLNDQLQPKRKQIIEDINNQYASHDQNSKKVKDQKQKAINNRIQLEKKKIQVQLTLAKGQTQKKKIIDEKLKKQTYISFFKEEQFVEKLIPQLKKTLYSYVVVFQEDAMVGRVKKFLRQNNFHQRVQLTSIQQQKQEKKIKNKIAQQFKQEIQKLKSQAPSAESSRQQLAEEPLQTAIQKKKTKQDLLFQYKNKYLRTKVPYQIKFQIMPLTSIHLYSPTDSTKDFFTRKIGLRIKTIKNRKQLQFKYLTQSKFQQIIESRILVCDVDNYKKQIFQILQKNAENENSGMYKIRIIIYDEDRQKISKLVEKRQNFHNNIQYIDFNKQRVQNFILQCKSSNVSLPFYRPSVLSDFQAKYKEIHSFKSSYFLNMESSVFSSNNIIREVLGDSLGLNTSYNFGIIGFSSGKNQIQQQIDKFEDNYVKSFISLWYFGFDIISGFFKNQDHISMIQKNQSKQQTQKNLKILKQQICQLYYKCKSYYLLNVSDKDFQQFYIDRINQCKDLLDLQSACIYALSLPHGFSSVISDLLKQPKKSKLAIKVFVVYFLILMTAFYNVGAEEEDTASLTAYLEVNKEINNHVKALKEGDTIFTNDFVFCVDSKKNISDKDNIKAHQINFKFDSIVVLENSKIKSYLNIEKYSFYKEGSEFVISPFTKFIVKSVKKNIKGHYEIQLYDVTNRTQSFPYRLLLQNQITQQKIHNVIRQQYKQYYKADSNKNKGNSRKTKIQANLPLYKKTQIVNIIKNKQQILDEFKKGENYNLFFQSKNKRKYLTALMYLNKEVVNIQSMYDKISTDKHKESQAYKAIGIERAYVHYQMNQYLNSLYDLKKVKNVLDLEGFNQKEQWKKSKVSKMIQSVQSTYQHRVDQIFNHPKRKLWTVTVNKQKTIQAINKYFSQNQQKQKPKDKAKDNLKEKEKQKEREKLKLKEMQKFMSKCTFGVKRKKQQWEVLYNGESQVFHLKYKQNLSKNQIKKVIQQDAIIVESPPSQFGSSLTAQRDTKIFDYLRRFEQNEKQKAKKGVQVEFNEKLYQQQIIPNFDPLENYLLKGTKPKQWRIFYSKNVAVLAVKKNKYHNRSKNCCHEHNQQQENEYFNTEKKFNKYYVPNDSSVVDQFILNEPDDKKLNAIGFSVDIQ